MYPGSRHTNIAVISTSASRRSSISSCTVSSSIVDFEGEEKESVFQQQQRPPLFMDRPSSTSQYLHHGRSPSPAFSYGGGARASSAIGSAGRRTPLESTFITQRSRPSSSTSYMNDVVTRASHVMEMIEEQQQQQRQRRAVSRGGGGVTALVSRRNLHTAPSSTNHRTRSAAGGGSMLNNGSFGSSLATANQSLRSIIGGIDSAPLLATVNNNSTAWSPEASLSSSPLGNISSPAAAQRRRVLGEEEERDDLGTPIDEAEQDGDATAIVAEQQQQKQMDPACVAQELEDNRRTILDTLRIAQERTELTVKAASQGWLSSSDDQVGGDHHNHHHQSHHHMMHGGSPGSGLRGRSSVGKMNPSQHAIMATRQQPIPSFSTPSPSSKQVTRGVASTNSATTTDQKKHNNTSLLLDKDADEVDVQLHAVLGVNFEPIFVPVPSVLTAATAAAVTDLKQHHQSVTSSSSSPTPSGPLPLGNMQIAKLASQMNNEIVIQSSVARRDRRNCFSHALQVLREQRDLHERFKLNVAHLKHMNDDAASIGGDASWSSDRRGGGHGRSPSPPSSSRWSNGSTSPPMSPKRLFLNENQKLAAEPWKLKALAKEHRKDQEERGKLVRYMRDTQIEAFSQHAEAQLTVIRGAERSRDRQWITVLSFLFSTKAVWSCFMHARQVADASSCGSGGGGSVSEEHVKNFCSDPLARGLERKRLEQVRALESHEIDRVQPLIEALQNSCFADRVHFFLFMRRVHAARMIRLLLTTAVRVVHTKRSIRSLILMVRLIQRCFRRFSRRLRDRRATTAVQLDAFALERVFYNRQVCQETKDFEKRKSVAKAKNKAKEQLQNYRNSKQQLQEAAGGGGATATPTTTTSASGNGVVSTSPVHKVASTRRLSEALRRSSSAAPPSLIATATGGTSKPPTGQAGAQQQQAAAAAAASTDAATSSPSQHWKVLIAAAHALAAPWLPFIEHHNGKFGADPTSARLVAMETHSFYTAVGARINPRIREKLLQFIEIREGEAFRVKKTEWRNATLEARHQYLWLQELAVVQAHMKRSPAKEELRTFRWPSMPIRRCLLTPNEMRLIVLLGFVLMAEEKAHSAATTAGPSSANAAATTAANTNLLTPPSAGGIAGGDENSADNVSQDEDGNGTVASASVTSPRSAQLAANHGTHPPSSHHTQQHHLEQQQSAHSHHHHHPITSEDRHHMVEILRSYHAQLQLPDVTPEFLRQW